MIRRARRYHREFLEESRVTSDPTLRAVSAEDAVLVSGDVATRRLAQLISLCFSIQRRSKHRQTILPPGLPPAALDAS